MSDNFPKVKGKLKFHGKDAMEDKEKILDSMTKIETSEDGGLFGKKFQKSIDPETLQKMEEAKKKQAKKRSLSSLLGF